MMLTRFKAGEIVALHFITRFNEEEPHTINAALIGESPWALTCLDLQGRVRITVPWSNVYSIVGIDGEVDHEVKAALDEERQAQVNERARQEAAARLLMGGQQLSPQ